jgi:hypothetical protein
MMTIKKIIVAVFVLGSFVVIVAQPAGKNYLLPNGAVVNGTNIAVNRGGQISITESGNFPIDPLYSCDKPPSGDEKSTVGIVLDRDPNGNSAEGLKAVADAMHTSIAQSVPPLKETTVAGAHVFSSETTQGCIESANKSKKVLNYDAFWIQDKNALRFGATGMTPAAANKYLEEVIAKAKALNSAAVTNQP